MASKTFWTQYFEDAYADAISKRRELLERGLLLVAHLIRTDLPAATAITVNGSVLTAVHDEHGVIWQLSDETRAQLGDHTRSDVRNTLLDLWTFYSTPAPLVDAGWKPNSLTGSFRVALPDDPDKDQEPIAAPAADARPTGTPGQNAGNCANCGHLLIWDGSGRRVNDEWGEYLCHGDRAAGVRAGVHVLAAAETTTRN
ncbi:hypothetical protein [Streptomyces sp. NPDC004763]